MPTKARELEIVQWSENLNTMLDGLELLGVDTSVKSVEMSGSTATGERLVTNGFLGADVIRIAAGDGFKPHTHTGDHLLFVIAGESTITYGGKVTYAPAGTVYMVEGMYPHAVGAITDTVIIAVGAPHRALDDPERMSLVEYEEILTEFEGLYCTICKVNAGPPNKLHHTHCTHCPCAECH